MPFFRRFEIKTYSNVRNYRIYSVDYHESQISKNLFHDFGFFKIRCEINTEKRREILNLFNVPFLTITVGITRINVFWKDSFMGFSKEELFQLGCRLHHRFDYKDQRS